MVSILPFNTATFNGTAIPAEEFVYGSGALLLMGNDIFVATGDHKIHAVRKSIASSGRCQLYGDRAELNSPGGLSQEQTLGDEIFKGVVTAKYDDGSHTTHINITGDAEYETSS